MVIHINSDIVHVHVHCVLHVGIASPQVITIIQAQSFRQESFTDSAPTVSILAKQSLPGSFFFPSHQIQAPHWLLFSF